jgi:hypothetical protein
VDTYEKEARPVSNVIGSFPTAFVASFITWAVWGPFYDLNPLINVILVLFDVLAWAAFVLSMIER